MSYERGQVVLVPFPFATVEGIRRKARPALVISDHTRHRRYGDLILAAITSRVPEKPLPTEVVIKESTAAFEVSGLKKTSTVRAEFLMTLPEPLIARSIGKLPSDTMATVSAALASSLGL